MDAVELNVVVVVFSVSERLKSTFEPHSAMIVTLPPMEIDFAPLSVAATTSLVESGEQVLSLQI
jgi:hypothetical protein